MTDALSVMCAVEWCQNTVQGGGLALEVCETCRVAIWGDEPDEAEGGQS